MLSDRPYQIEAEAAIHEHLERGVKRLLIALPTGTGKSVVIARFIRNVFQRWPRLRVMALTHVKELIEQNAERLGQAWPGAPIGVFSASVGRKDHAFPITFGGVQSVVRSLDLFDRPIHVLIIDEAHLVGPNADASYQQIIAYLLAINPALVIIGLSATVFRMGQGLLTEGDNPMFTHIAYNLCTVPGWARLIADGYLVPPIALRTDTEINVDNVSVSRATGDYNLAELQAAVDLDEITVAACNETVRRGANRRSWLTFCAGIENAEHVAAYFNQIGIPTAAIHSKITKEDREARIKAFKAGQLRCLTNNNVLTTGFDHPPVDLIAMLRPTTSSPLWVQMVGRGTRPYRDEWGGKENCLVLDFARNRPRLGPINDPVIPRPKGKGGGEAPTKICEACGTYNPISARVCEFCGTEFEFDNKLSRQASNMEMMRDGIPETHWFDVDMVFYGKRLSRKTDIPMLIANYKCGMKQFIEYVKFEHPGFPKHQAHEWWRQRHRLEPPDTVDEALSVQSELRCPKRIRVWTNKQFPEIISCEF